MRHSLIQTPLLTLLGVLALTCLPTIALAQGDAGTAITDSPGASSHPTTVLESARPQPDSSPSHLHLPSDLPTDPTVEVMPALEDEGEDLAAISGPASTAPDRPRYVVERIEVVGNTRTDRGVILSRVLIKPGELLDEEQVELSRLRLLATGFFTEVQLRLARGQVRGRVVLFVEVTERPPLPVVDGIILGFSETTPFFGGLSLVDTNFLGRGVELGGGFVLSPDQQAYRARISGGELFGTPLGARMVLLLSRGREPVALGEDPRGGGHVDVLRGGGFLGLSVAAGHDQRFSVDYHGEVIQADPKLSPRVRRTPLIQPGLSVLSTVQLAYQRDTRDRGFIPTSGSQLFVGAEFSSTLLLSAYEYSRFHLMYEQYIPTFAHHGFSLRLDLGVIQPGVARGNRSGAPYFEAYYIGDYSFFRRTRNSLPRQMGLNLSAFSTYDDLLGSLTASYAYPIQLGGDLFYRTYVYAAINLSEGTTVREIQGLDPGDDRFPVTFDAGIKFDTVAGSFVVSASYLVDLVL
ncbi:MAG: BamA/TamA family outer membrane protein [Pseudomonadota bacterium]